MFKHDLSIVGNIIVDNIHCVSNFRLGASNASVVNHRAVGSIVNVLTMCQKIDPNLNININSAIGNDNNGELVKTFLKASQNSVLTKADINLEIFKEATSTAIIIADLEQNKRTSIVKWGACTQMNSFASTPSDWTHIMYGDKLKNLNAHHLKKMKKDGIISIDFCLNKHSESEKKRIYKILEFVDYAILSDEEASSLTGYNNMFDITKEIGKMVTKSAIVHSPARIYESDGTAIKNYTTSYIEDIPLNVLAAGDTFAACFITKMLRGNDVATSIKFAHDYTTKYILKKS